MNNWIVCANVGHFDRTLYNQGLAELCLIMTLPLSVSLLLVFIYYEYIFNFTEYILFEQWYNWIVCANVGHFDRTLYNQGLAELRMIMTLPLSVLLLIVFIYEYIFKFTEYILFEQWYNWIVCSNNCWSFWRNTLSSGIGRVLSDHDIALKRIWPCKDLLICVSANPSFALISMFLHFHIWMKYSVLKNPV